MQRKDGDPFEVGDRVRLKSGGPPMTVSFISINGMIECQWFSGNKLQEGHFPPNALERIEKDDNEQRG